MGLCLLFLLAGLVRCVLSPDTEIAYENRPANRLPAPDAAAFLSGEYQDQIEDALADQLPQAIRMKKLYNIFDTRLALPVIRALGRGGGYVGFRDICFFEDMLVSRPKALAEKRDALLESARLISDWAAGSPETAFYVYYIESDRDLNLETGEKSGLFDCLKEALALPEGHVARLRVDNFTDYHALFFKTDHHWKAEGSYRAYGEICEMLGVEPLSLLERSTRPACFRGSRAAGVEGIPAEDFEVNVFDLPVMTVTIPYGELPDYGQQAQFIAGELESPSYGSVFGVDCGELLLDTGRAGQNLLVMGDSYDNAVAKPLAACFSQSRFVDLRSYEGETGRPFVMADYIRAHDIDCVLFLGGIDYFGANLPQWKEGSL